MTLGQKSFALLRREVLLIGVGLAANVLIARVLGPAQMGVWIILTMIPAYAEALGRMKADAAAVFFLGQGRARLGEMCFVVNVIALASSAVVLAACVGGAEVLRVHFLKAEVEAGVLALVLAGIPVHFVYLNYAYLLLAREDVRTYNRMIALREGSTAVLGVGGVLLWPGGVPALAGAALVGVLAGTAYGARAIHAVEPLVPVFDRRLVRDLLRYSATLYWTGVVAHLNTYVSGLLVALYLAPSQVTFLRLGQDMAQVLNKIPNALAAILFPRISRLGTDARVAADLAARSCRTALLLLAVGGALSMLLIRPLVHVLYGEAYLPLVISFWILVPGLVVGGATSTLHQFFMGTGRPTILLGVWTAGLAAQVALSLLVIPWLGFTGAAIVASVTAAAIGGVTVVLFARLTGAPPSSAIVPTRDDVRTVVGFAWSRIRTPSVLSGEKVAPL